MNKIPNRQVICDTLLELAKDDRDIMVLASDSRGSAAMAPFANTFPQQFVEVGIAEQNIVGMSAGLAHSGKKPFVTSPACFLSMRSIEQVKVDVAYSRTNVKLIGISGGVSYGALGMSHHSVQDIAVARAIPGLAIVLPADRHETKKVTEALVKYDGGVYVRIGRNPVA
ncbi:transketolase family protein, partial [Paenibacillus sp. OT2-17]|uniref:transketolase family protein n=1 Tax=Paenibacillus sp. OT2-17 TaxID=2691605 RepID=UPI00135510F4|nr:transketolase family protein [Paenibacillus sp. OT2-17]